MSNATQNGRAPAPELLTVTEAASYLRVSRWMIYRLIHTRQLTTLKLGNRRLVPRSAITALVAKLGTEGGSP